MDWAQILIDIADGFLFGIPSTVLLSDIQNKYNVEIADLQRSYDMLQKEYNDNADFKTALENKQYDILRGMSGMSPLGAWRNELQTKYDGIQKQVDQATKKAKDLTTKMVETSDKLTKKQLEANSSTLGREASKRF